MAKPVRREKNQPTRFQDTIFDWLESPLLSFAPFAATQMFRVEEYVEGDRFVIRADLPGVDPQKDIEIDVHESMLTIRAERREEHEEAHHCEFSYGSMRRSLRLPPGADVEGIMAKYDKGVLTIEVPMPEAKKEGRRILVEPAD